MDTVCAIAALYESCGQAEYACSTNIHHYRADCHTDMEYSIILHCQFTQALQGSSIILMQNTIGIGHGNQDIYE